MTRAQRIYASGEDRRIDDFKEGFKYAMRSAAEFVNSWDGDISPHKLGDLLLMKFNMTKQKPRLSRIYSRTDAVRMARNKNGRLVVKP